MKNILTPLTILIIIINTIPGISQNNMFLKDLKTCKHRVISTSTKNVLVKMDSCYIGLTLPDFNAKTIDNTVIDTKSFKNKVVVINIWSTQCGPCIAELPGLNDIVEKYQDKDILFVALTNERKEMINNFLASGHTYKFQIIPFAKSIYYNQLDSFGFPRTIVVDKKGIIRSAFSGGVNSKKAPELVKEKLVPTIDKLLSE